MAVNSDVLRVCVHLGEIGTFRKHDMYKRQYKMGIQYKYVTNASAQLRDTRITVCARNMVISVMEFQAWEYKLESDNKNLQQAEMFRQAQIKK